MCPVSPTPRAFGVKTLQGMSVSTLFIVIKFIPLTPHVVHTCDSVIGHKLNYNLGHKP